MKNLFNPFYTGNLTSALHSLLRGIFAPLSESRGNTKCGLRVGDHQNFLEKRLLSWCRDRWYLARVQPLIQRSKLTFLPTCPSGKWYQMCTCTRKFQLARKKKILRLFTFGKKIWYTSILLGKSTEFAYVYPWSRKTDDVESFDKKTRAKI